MLKTVVICGAAAIASVLAAQAVVSLDKRGGTAMAAVATAPLRAEGGSASHAGAAQIAKSADGHFWADASVNGSHVHFLVDTGATAVALTPTDAQRLGFEADELDFNYKVMTASGEARAARVVLDSVAVSSAKVTKVDAYVIEKGLETSLLGMTYIGRLNGFEATQTSLTFKP